MGKAINLFSTDIIDTLQPYIDSVVEHYGEYDFGIDAKFFTKEANEIAESNKPRSYLWFVRKNGTNVCTENEAYMRETPANIRFKYYDEQESSEATTIRAFVVTITGVTNDRPVGTVQPINYFAECDRIRHYAVLASKMKLIYENGEQFMDVNKYIIYSHPKWGKCLDVEYIPDNEFDLKYALDQAKNARKKK